MYTHTDLGDADYNPSAAIFPAWFLIVERRRPAICSRVCGGRCPRLVKALQKRYTPETAADFGLDNYDYVVDAIDSLPDKASLILRPFLCLEWS